MENFCTHIIKNRESNSRLRISIIKEAEILILYSIPNAFSILEVATVQICFWGPFWYIKLKILS